MGILIAWQTRLLIKLVGLIYSADNHRKSKKCTANVKHFDKTIIFFELKFFFPSIPDMWKGFRRFVLGMIKFAKLSDKILLASAAAKTAGNQETSIVLISPENLHLRIALNQTYSSIPTPARKASTICCSRRPLSSESSHSIFSC